MYRHFVLLVMILVISVLQSGCSTKGSGQPESHGSGRPDLESNQPDLESNQPESGNPVLLISIDGFMPEYMERNHTPHLDRLVETGVLAESMISVFPTKTFPTHYTIVTGLFTENHGIISNHFNDYRLDGRFSFGPPGGSDDDEWWGGEPIWVTAEKQGKTSATMFWPGSDSRINGVRPSRYKDFDNSFPNLARIDTVISWLDPAGDVQADFGSVYFSDVDVAGHSYGPHSDEVDSTVALADEWIGILLERMNETGLAGKLNLIIVSDHGMAELSDDRLIFLDDLIDLDDVDIIDRTPVAMIRPKEGHREDVYRTLKENEENYLVYLKEDMPDEYHFRDHYRIPDIIMISDSGYFITTHETYRRRGIPAGMHGYDHRLPEMQAFFLAAGPAFRKNLKTKPFQSIHLYEMMSFLLDIKAAPNDGRIDSLKHILN